MDKADFMLTMWKHGGDSSRASILAMLERRLNARKKQLADRDHESIHSLAHRYFRKRRLVRAFGTSGYLVLPLSFLMVYNFNHFGLLLGGYLTVCEIVILFWCVFFLGFWLTSKRGIPK